MTAYYQETDTKVIFAIPRFTYPFTIRPMNETIGSELPTYYLPVSKESGLFRNGWKVVRQLKNQEMARDAKQLLVTIQDIVISFQRRIFDVSNLPPLNAFIADDGSTYFEWTSSDFRIGFSIELDPNESGWYLVSNKKLGDISASGYIAVTDIKNLIVWLLSFVLSNS